MTLFSTRYFYLPLPVLSFLQSFNDLQPLLRLKSFVKAKRPPLALANAKKSTVKLFLAFTAFHNFDVFHSKLTKLTFMLLPEIPENNNGNPMKADWLFSCREWLDNCFASPLDDHQFETIANGERMSYFFVRVNRQRWAGGFNGGNISFDAFYRLIKDAILDSSDIPNHILPSKADLLALKDGSPLQPYNICRLQACFTHPLVRAKSGLEAEFQRLGVLDGFGEGQLVPSIHLFDPLKFDAARGNVSIKKVAENIQLPMHLQHCPRKGAEQTLNALRSDRPHYRNGPGYYRMPKWLASSIYDALLLTTDQPNFGSLTDLFTDDPIIDKFQRSDANALPLGSPVTLQLGAAGPTRPLEALHGGAY